MSATTAAVNTTEAELPTARVIADDAIRAFHRLRGRRVAIARHERTITSAILRHDGRRARLKTWYVTFDSAPEQSSAFAAGVLDHVHRLVVESIAARPLEHGWGG